MDTNLIVGSIIGIVSQRTVGVHIAYESAIDVQITSINEDYWPRCWEPMIEQQTFSFAIIWLFIFYWHRFDVAALNSWAVSIKI